MPASKGSALLAEWRRSEKISQLGLAERMLGEDPKVRASQASVSNWEHGLLDPPARAVVLLESITGGAVYARSWFEPAAESPSPEAA